MLSPKDSELNKSPPQKSVIGSAFAIVRNYFTPERHIKKPLSPIPSEPGLSSEVLSPLSSLGSKLSALNLNESLESNDSFRTSFSRNDESFKSTVSTLDDNEQENDDGDATVVHDATLVGDHVYNSTPNVSPSKVNTSMPVIDITDGDLDLLTNVTVQEISSFDAPLSPTSPDSGLPSEAHSIESPVHDNVQSSYNSSMFVNYCSNETMPAEAMVDMEVPFRDEVRQNLSGFIDDAQLNLIANKQTDAVGPSSSGIFTDTRLTSEDLLAGVAIGDFPEHLLSEETVLKMVLSQVDAFETDVMDNVAVPSTSGSAYGSGRNTSTGGGMDGDKSVEAVPTADSVMPNIVWEDVDDEICIAVPEGLNSSDVSENLTDSNLSNSSDMSTVDQSNVLISSSNNARTAVPEMSSETDFENMAGGSQDLHEVIKSTSASPCSFPESSFVSNNRIVDDVSNSSFCAKKSPSSDHQDLDSSQFELQQNLSFSQSNLPAAIGSATERAKEESSVTGNLTFESERDEERTLAGSLLEKTSSVGDSRHQTGHAEEAGIGSVEKASLVGDAKIEIEKQVELLVNTTTSSALLLEKEREDGRTEVKEKEALTCDSTLEREREIENALLGNTSSSGDSTFEIERELENELLGNTSSSGDSTYETESDKKGTSVLMENTPLTVDRTFEIERDDEIVTDGESGDKSSSLDNSTFKTEIDEKTSSVLVENTSSTSGPTFERDPEDTVATVSESGKKSSSLDNSTFKTENDEKASSVLVEKTSSTRETTSEHDRQDKIATIGELGDNSSCLGNSTFETENDEKASCVLEEKTSSTGDTTSEHDRQDRIATISELGEKSSCLGNSTFETENDEKVSCVLEEKTSSTGDTTSEHDRQDRIATISELGEKSSCLGNSTFETENDEKASSVLEEKTSSTGNTTLEHDQKETVNESGEISPFIGNATLEAGCDNEAAVVAISQLNTMEPLMENRSLDQDSSEPIERNCVEAEACETSEDVPFEVRLSDEIPVPSEVLEKASFYQTLPDNTVPSKLSPVSEQLVPVLDLSYSPAVELLTKTGCERDHLEVVADVKQSLEELPLENSISHSTFDHTAAPADAVLDTTSNNNNMAPADSTLLSLAMDQSRPSGPSENITTPWGEVEAKGLNSTFDINDLAAALECGLNLGESIDSGAGKEEISPEGETDVLQQSIETPAQNLVLGASTPSDKILNVNQNSTSNGALVPSRENFEVTEDKSPEGLRAIGDVLQDPSGTVTPCEVEDNFNLTQDTSSNGALAPSRDTFEVAEDRSPEGLRAIGDVLQDPSGTVTPSEVEDNFNLTQDTSSNGALVTNDDFELTRSQSSGRPVTDVLQDPSGTVSPCEVEDNFNLTHDKSSNGALLTKDDLELTQSQSSGDIRPVTDVLQDPSGTVAPGEVEDNFKMTQDTSSNGANDDFELTQSQSSRGPVTDVLQDPSGAVTPCNVEDNFQPAQDPSSKDTMGAITDNIELPEDQSSKKAVTPIKVVLQDPSSKDTASNVNQDFSQVPSFDSVTPNEVNDNFKLTQDPSSKDTLEAINDSFNHKTDPPLNETVALIDNAKKMKENPSSNDADAIENAFQLMALSPLAGDTLEDPSSNEIRIPNDDTLVTEYSSTVGAFEQREEVTLDQALNDAVTTIQNSSQTAEDRLANDASPPLENTIESVPQLPSNETNAVKMTVLTPCGGTIEPVQELSYATEAPTEDATKMTAHLLANDSLAPCGGTIEPVQEFSYATEAPTEDATKMSAHHLEIDSLAPCGDAIGPTQELFSSETVAQDGDALKMASDTFSYNAGRPIEQTLEETLSNKTDISSVEASKLLQDPPPNGYMENTSPSTLETDVIVEQPSKEEAQSKIFADSSLIVQKVGTEIPPVQVEANPASIPNTVITDFPIQQSFDFDVTVNKEALRNKINADDESQPAPFEINPINFLTTEVVDLASSVNSSILQDSSLFLPSEDNALESLPPEAPPLDISALLATLQASPQKQSGSQESLSRNLLDISAASPVNQSVVATDWNLLDVTIPSTPLKTETIPESVSLTEQPNGIQKPPSLLDSSLPTDSLTAICSIMSVQPELLGGNDGKAVFDKNESIQEYEGQSIFGSISINANVLETKEKSESVPENTLPDLSPVEPLGQVFSMTDTFTVPASDAQSSLPLGIILPEFEGEIVSSLATLSPSYVPEAPEFSPAEALRTLAPESTLPVFGGEMKPSSGIESLSTVHVEAEAHSASATGFASEALRSSSAVTLDKTEAMMTADSSSTVVANEKALSVVENEGVSSSTIEATPADDSDCLGTPPETKAQLESPSGPPEDIQGTGNIVFVPLEHLEPQTVVDATDQFDSLTRPVGELESMSVVVEAVTEDTTIADQACAQPGSPKVGTERAPEEIQIETLSEKDKTPLRSVENSVDELKDRSCLVDVSSPSSIILSVVQPCSTPTDGLFNQTITLSESAQNLNETFAIDVSPLAIIASHPNRTIPIEGNVDTAMVNETFRISPVHSLEESDGAMNKTVTVEEQDIPSTVNRTVVIDKNNVNNSVSVDEIALLADNCDKFLELKNNIYPADDCKFVDTAENLNVLTDQNEMALGIMCKEKDRSLSPSKQKRKARENSPKDSALIGRTATKSKPKLTVDAKACLGVLKELHDNIPEGTMGSFFSKPKKPDFMKDTTTLFGVSSFGDSAEATNFQADDSKICLEALKEMQDDFGLNSEDEMGSLFSKTISQNNEKTDSSKLYGVSSFGDGCETFNTDFKPDDFDMFTSRSEPSDNIPRESLYVKFDPIFQSRGDNTLFIDDLKPPARPPINVVPAMPVVEPIQTSKSLSNPLDAPTKQFAEVKDTNLLNEISRVQEEYVQRLDEANRREKLFQEQKIELAQKIKEETEKLLASEERQREMNEQIYKLSKWHEDMYILMPHFEATIENVTEEARRTRKDFKKQIETLTTEKDTFNDHIKSAEAAFMDVASKFEKARFNVIELKTSQTVLEREVTELRRTVLRLDERIRSVGEVAAEDQLDLDRIACQQMELQSGDVNKLRAQLKKAELQLSFVQETLETKTKENQKLAAICDDLIGGKIIT